MLRPILTNKELIQLMELIKDSKSVFICGHRGPDGDAMGAALGWREYLLNLGKDVFVAMPNPCPDFLRWMPCAQQVKFYSESTAEVSAAIKKADLIFLLDMNEAGRTQDMAAELIASKAKKAIIDHHLNPSCEGYDCVVSRPKLSSTSELVLRIIHQLGGYDRLTRSAAACIYTGMMTEIRSFIDTPHFCSFEKIHQKGLQGYAALYSQTFPRRVVKRPHSRPSFNASRSFRRNSL